MQLEQNQGKSGLLLIPLYTDCVMPKQLIQYSHVNNLSFSFSKSLSQVSHFHESDFDGGVYFSVLLHLELFLLLCREPFLLVLPVFLKADVTLTWTPPS